MAQLQNVDRLHERIALLEEQLVNAITSQSMADIATAQAEAKILVIAAERDNMRAALENERNILRVTTGRLEHAEGALEAERRLARDSAALATAAAQARGEAEGRLAAIKNIPPAPVVRPSLKGWKITLQKDELGTTRSFDLEPKTT